MLQLAVADAASNEEKLAWEQELLGTYVSPHPLMDAEARFREAQALLVGEVTSEHDGQRVGVGGMIKSPRSFSTKDGRPMGSFQLADMQSTLEVVIFSRSYEQLQSKIADGAIVVVDGKIDGSDGRVRLLADGVWTLEEAKDRPAPTNGNGNGNGKKNGNGNGHTNGASNGNGHSTPPPVLVAPSCRLTIEFRRSSDRAGDISRIEEIYAALQAYSGADEVEIVLRQGTRLISIPLPNGRVRWCRELEQQLLALIPAEMYRVTPLGQAESAPSAAVGESAGGGH
jgi:DNA polymerase III alpha subunit